MSQVAPAPHSCEFLFHLCFCNCCRLLSEKALSLSALE
jgi:hypothetical protein